MFMSSDEFNIAFSVLNDHIEIITKINYLKIKTNNNI